MSPHIVGCGPVVAEVGEGTSGDGAVEQITAKMDTIARETRMMAQIEKYDYM
jgi:hypothetical protein